ncbi:DVU_1551 family NTP transferase [Desulfonatronum sp. SC1]|uniref:DVU_1551 family NTP transferase n=1 Tax=Desulfonatronum sp. SC1 TaxID=2109626 RepID=UPI001304BC07|nr:NTP transferase domain-containing protein [Desulfonatronum sp. SC1]
MSPRGNWTAVILAAGFSSRMGSFKPLLPLAGQTALERCATVFREAGVDDVRVVVGHRRDELEPLAHDLGLRTIINAHPENGMFSSVHRAIQAMSATPLPRPWACLLLPVDIATVRGATVSRLLAHWTSLWQGNGNAPQVLLPRFHGQTGHPALLTQDAFADILNWGGTNGNSGGLRGWMQHRLPRGPATVAVADAGILMDMDRPTDADKLRKHLIRTHNLSIPTPEECSELHLLYSPDPSRRAIRVHCLAVARAALRMASTLNRNDPNGERMSLEVLASAALVHDVAKGEAEHGQAGAAFLRGHGFVVIAELVARHHQFDAVGHGEVNETTLLQLADMLLIQDKPSSLKERFAMTVERFRDNAAALMAIRTKFSTANRLYEQVARRLGEKPETTAQRPIPEETGLLAGFTP